jgi:hypothetical protein
MLKNATANSALGVLTPRSVRTKRKKIETGEETIGDTGEGKEDDELEPEDKLAFDIRNSPVFLEYQKYSNPITTPSDKAHLPFLDFERTQEWIYHALPSLMDHKERTKVAVKWKTGDGLELGLMSYKDICKALNECGFSSRLYEKSRNTVGWRDRMDLFREAYGDKE